MPPVSIYHMHSTCHEVSAVVYTRICNLSKSLVFSDFQFCHGAEHAHHARDLQSRICRSWKIKGDELSKDSWPLEDEGWGDTRTSGISTLTPGRSGALFPSQIKTWSIVLILCLKIGVNPPDVVKTDLCPRWIGEWGTWLQVADYHLNKKRRCLYLLFLLFSSPTTTHLLPHHPPHPTTTPHSYTNAYMYSHIHTQDPSAWAPQKSLEKLATRSETVRKVAAQGTLQAAADPTTEDVRKLSWRIKVIKSAGIVLSLFPGSCAAQEPGNEARKQKKLPWDLWILLPRAHAQQGVEWSVCLSVCPDSVQAVWAVKPLLKAYFRIEVSEFSKY